MVNRLAAQMHVQLENVWQKPGNQSAWAGQVGAAEFSTQMRIEIEAAMSLLRELCGKVLGSLDTRMPIGSGKKENVWKLA